MLDFEIKQTMEFVHSEHYNLELPIEDDGQDLQDRPKEFMHTIKK